MNLAMSAWEKDTDICHIGVDATLLVQGKSAMATQGKGSLGRTRTDGLWWMRDKLAEGFAFVPPILNVYSEVLIIRILECDLI